MAVEAGYQSVHAFPMRLRTEVVGALNLFSTDAEHRRRGRRRGAGPGRRRHDRPDPGARDRAEGALTEQLQSALNSRIVIEQAKGAIAQIHGGTPDEAFVRIRTFCRGHHLRLSDVARAIINDPQRFPELTRP